MNWTRRIKSQTQQQLEQVVQLFNKGQFHQAHQGFEKLLHNAQAGEGRFFQGLLQVALAFHFHSQQNLAEAMGMLDSATRNLAAYAGEYHGVQLTALLCRLNEWRTALREQSTSLSLPRIEVHRGVSESKSHDGNDSSQTVRLFHI